MFKLLYLEVHIYQSVFSHFACLRVSALETVCEGISAILMPVSGPCKYTNIVFSSEASIRNYILTLLLFVIVENWAWYYYR